MFDFKVAKSVGISIPVSSANFVFNALAPATILVFRLAKSVGISIPVNSVNLVPSADAPATILVFRLAKSVGISIPVNSVNLVPIAAAPVIIPVLRLAKSVGISIPVSSVNLVPRAAAPDLIKSVVALNPAPISIPVKSANLVFNAVAPSLIDVTVSVNFVDIAVPTSDIVPSGSFAKSAIPPAIVLTPSVNEVQPSEKNVPILSIPAEIDSCDTSPNVNPDAAPAIPSLTAEPNLPDFLYSAIPADIPSKMPIAAVTASPIGPANLAALAAPRSNPFPTVAAPLATPPTPLATAPTPLPAALIPDLISVPVVLTNLDASPPIVFLRARSPTPIFPKLSNNLLRNPPSSSSPFFPPNPPLTSCCNNEVCFSCSLSCASVILLSSPASSDADAPLILGAPPMLGEETIVAILSATIIRVSSVANFSRVV